VTNQEIADALVGYHEALMLTARNAVEPGKVGRIGYQFRSMDGKDLPQLDVLAEALRASSVE
jgi:hypothetical protein